MNNNHSVDSFGAEKYVYLMAICLFTTCHIDHANISNYYTLFISSSVLAIVLEVGAQVAMRLRKSDPGRARRVKKWFGFVTLHVWALVTMINSVTVRIDCVWGNFGWEKFIASVAVFCVLIFYGASTNRSFLLEWTDREGRWARRFIRNTKKCPRCGGMLPGFYDSARSSNTNMHPLCRSCGLDLGYIMRIHEGSALRCFGARTQSGRDAVSHIHEDTQRH